MPNPSSDPVGDLAPAVDPLDLQRVFTMMSTVHAMSTAHGQKSGMIDIGIYKKLCSPEADINAVWYRASMLMWLCQGPLVVNDKVFEVAARFPMKQMQPGIPQQGPPFDVNEFLKQIDQTQ